MIQSETGTSDVHFEKGGGVGHGGGDLGDGLGGAEGGGADAGEESKIKGLVALEAADGVSRQLAASDCSSGPCGGGDSNKASLTASTASNLKGIFLFWQIIFLSAMADLQFARIQKFWPKTDILKRNNCNW